jgi:hypothetical protein
MGFLRFSNLYANDCPNLFHFVDILWSTPDSGQKSRSIRARSMVVSLVFHAKMALLVYSKARLSLEFLKTTYRE